MDMVKKVVVRCITLFISLCISLVIAANLFYRRLKVGRDFFRMKTYVAPQSLLDSELGIHNYIYLKNQGIKLHYVEKGDRCKPLILLVHGFYESWFSWRHQLGEFSADYWVVAVSLRGYDDSDKPSGTSEYTLMKMVEDLREFVLALGKDKCTFIGHDGGAVVGWVLVSKYPDLFERFITCNGSHPFAYKTHLKKSFKQMKKSWYVFFNQMPYLPELCFAANDYELLCRFYYEDNENSETFTDEVIQAYKYYFSQKGALTVAVNFYRNIDFMSSLQIPKMRIPTLIIWGTENKFLDKELAKLSARECEDVQVKYIDGAGHFVQQQEPVYFNKLIWEYISITQ
ncbi:epoxide hydrolase 4-like isoform X2 [Penaeus japonicus]|uniref:epoxide hydrolase 4-like isoform X2 n=1 Tax=Penaeus japonicus TaxID=27405 RepID=UPI001C713055|nr:epoxide hydrolase 4-like isoform X2 [Penaeus japonicus]